MKKYDWRVNPLVSLRVPIYRNEAVPTPLNKHIARRSTSGGDSSQ